MHLLDVSAPLLRRLGHRRRPPADRRRRGAGARATPSAPTPCSASSATAQPTSAPSTRRSTWPRVWDLPIVFLVDQQPVRHGHLGRAVVGRARAVAAGGGLPDARRAGGRQGRAGGARGGRGGCSSEARERAPAGADRDRHLPLSRPLRRRRRQGVSHRRGDRGLAQARPDHPASGCCSPSRACCRRRRSRRSGATSPPRSKAAIDEALARRLPRSATASTSTSTATPPGASSSPRMRAGGAVRRARRGAIMAD